MSAAGLLREAADAAEASWRGPMSPAEADRAAAQLRAVVRALCAACCQLAAADAQLLPCAIALLSAWRLASGLTGYGAPEPGEGGEYGDVACAAARYLLYEAARRQLRAVPTAESAELAAAAGSLAGAAACLAAQPGTQAAQLRAVSAALAAAALRSDPSKAPLLSPSRPSRRKRPPCHPPQPQPACAAQRQQTMPAGGDPA